VWRPALWRLFEVGQHLVYGKGSVARRRFTKRSVALRHHALQVAATVLTHLALRLAR
jgi:hypothetical protein